MYRMNHHVAEILSLLVFFLSALFPGPAYSAGPDDELRSLPGAVDALHEYDLACAEEGGRLWGASLCGPMLVVDPASRIVTANTADTGGLLQPSGDLFVGALPENVGLANTAIEWSGRRWSMVILPLPEEVRARRALMLHEAWHRVQDELGLPSRACDNSHLEQTRARVWMRLEWRALARALSRQGEPRLAALNDALHFRFHRQLLFPGSVEQEACLELNEGLAEYTGLRAAFGGETMSAAVQKLAAADETQHLARSFAYLLGPAYGLLLDELTPDWRRQLTTSSDLGTLAAQSMPGWSPDLCQVTARAESYGYREVKEQEARLGQEREARHAALHAALVDAPGLVLPLEEMEMQFDPRQVIGFAPHGTVYLQLTARDSWGTLEASEGALIATDFRSLALPGAVTSVEDGVIAGDTWHITLADGWRLETGGPGPATAVRDPSR